MGNLNKWQIGAMIVTIAGAALSIFGSVCDGKNTQYMIDSAVNRKFESMNAKQPSNNK